MVIEGTPRVMRKKALKKGSKKPKKVLKAVNNRT